MPRGRSKKKHASSDEDAESDADVQIMNDGAGAAAAAAAGGSSSSSRHSAALAKHMASLTRVTPVCINRDDDGDGSDAQQAAAAAAAADEEEEKDAQAKNKKGKKLKGDKKDAVMKDEEGKDVAAASTAAAAASSAGAAAAPATRPSSEPSLYVPPEIAGLLKPHQIAGLRFIWRNMVSSAGSLEAARAQKASEGRGCLLAHFCGLGKTVTTISFLYVYLRSGVGRRALIVAPVNTLANWIAEFDKWLRPKHRLDVWALDSCQAHGGRTVQEVRYRCIKEWAKSEGGVLIAGYEGFRHICAAGAGKSGNGAAKKGKQTHKQQEKAKKGPRGISAKHAAAVRQMLLESADVVVADEAHRIKNSKSALAQAMASLVTRRRLTLTGTPLQNNTRELFAMIEFTRPGYLGSEAEFVARFDGPIRAGQCLDSTPDEVERMKKRIHVLHKKLAPLVHRVDYATLQSGGKDSYGISIAQKDNSDEHPPPPQDPTSIRHISVLPRKTEYVCFVRLSPLQRALYKRFISTHKLSMLKAYAALMKIGQCQWA
jgi:RAD54-like protein 2